MNLNANDDTDEDAEKIPSPGKRGFNKWASIEIY